eukprot:c55111_g1_i1 orf=1-195(-)
MFMDIHWHHLALLSQVYTAGTLHLTLSVNFVSVRPLDGFLLTHGDCGLTVIRNCALLFYFNDNLV